MCWFKCWILKLFFSTRACTLLFYSIQFPTGKPLTDWLIKPQSHNTLKVARAYSKFLSEVPYFLLFYFLQKVNQIGRTKIGGNGPFKLKILLLNRYVKGTIFQWNDRENSGVDIFLSEYKKKRSMTISPKTVI